MIGFAGRLILLDIEGTVAPLAFVHEVLFPYARSGVADFLSRHRDSTEVLKALEQVARDSGTVTEPGTTAAVARLDAETGRAAWVARIQGLIDADAKQTGLKALQGLIWAEGYQSGRIRSPLFDDAAEALRIWHRWGMRLRIYSSGSIAAQRLFFGHAEGGDLTGCLEAYHDTTTGPKREAASYRAIAEAAGLPAQDILFLSDVTQELDAAQEAGCRTAWVVRPGNPAGSTDRHPLLRHFAEIRLS